MKRDRTKRCRLTRTDWIVCASLGVAVCAAQLVLSVPGADPSQWQSLAIAAGLLPPRDVVPGFWHHLVSWLFTLFGIGTATRALAVLGALFSGVLASLAYVVTRQALVLSVRLVDDSPVYFEKIVPFFAASAAVLLAVSPPVWHLAQTFNADQLHAALFLALAALWLKWLTAGGAVRLYLATLGAGLLSADTPFALSFVPGLFLLGYFALWRQVREGFFEAPKALPRPEAFPKWKVFFLFTGALGLGVWLNATIFACREGVAANAWDRGELYFRYGMGYAERFFGASTLAGWVLGLALGLMPLVVAVRTCPLAVTDERGKRRGVHVLLFFAACLAAMQLGALPGARFWALEREAVLVPSGFLLALYVLCAALALALAAAAFTFTGLETLARDAKRPKTRKYGLAVARAVPALVLGMVVWTCLHAPQPVETAMMRLVHEAIGETLDECGEAKWIFTDGQLDDALRLAAAARGQSLEPLNLMSGPGAWERSVRERAFPETSIERVHAATGIPALLRVWACETPHGLKDAAVQLGFELWKREMRALPKMSGLVAREEGLTDEAARQGIERCEALARRILDLGPRVEAARPSPAARRAFAAVAWRLSRFARLRGDTALAERLDRSDAGGETLFRADEERRRTFMQLTPREGLMIALRRADFTEAKRYAASVLRSDEDDLEANFGMGMGCLKEGKLEDAERYLRACLKTRPDEPAVLNNLAIICRKTGRAEEAVQLARHALEMLPDSAEVKQTLADAERDLETQSSPQ